MRRGEVMKTETKRSKKNTERKKEKEESRQSTCG